MLRYNLNPTINLLSSVDEYLNIHLVKKIKASGANVVLIQKSILRDATNDLSLHFLAKANIMVIKNIEREDIEFISKVN